MSTKRLGVLYSSCAAEDEKWIGESVLENEFAVCSLRSFSTWPPICASQSRTMLSLEPDTMCLPSGENATEKTESVCPWRGLPTWPPVCASQSWIVLSLEPDTMCLPSGENATDKTEKVCPWRGLPTWPPVSSEIPR